MAELAVAAAPVEAAGMGVAGAASLEGAAVGASLETGVGAALETGLDTGAEVVTPEAAAAGAQLGNELTVALQETGAEPGDKLAELAASAPETPGDGSATPLEIGPDGLPVAKAANGTAAEGETPPGNREDSVPPGDGESPAEGEETPPEESNEDADEQSAGETRDETDEKDKKDDKDKNEKDKPIDKNEAEKLQNELQQLMAEKTRLLMQNNQMSTIVATELRAFTAAEATIINSNNTRIGEIDKRIAEIQGRVQQEAAKPGNKDSLAMMALILMLAMTGSMAAASK